MGLSSYLTWWQADPALRLALLFGVNGTLLLLERRTMFTAGLRLAPGATCSRLYRRRPGLRC